MSPEFLARLKRRLISCKRNDTVETLYRELSGWLRRKQADFGGHPMISVSRLAEALQVARQTLQKVYAMLEREGLISREDSKRNWIVSRIRQSDQPAVALILPFRFSDYYRCSLEYGERHFGVYTGLMDRAEELGYTLVPKTLPPPDSSEREIALAVENLRRHYMGILHLGYRGAKDDPLLAAVVALDDVPQVSIDCIFPDSKVGAVTFDPVHTANIVAAHLQENGHRSIGIVCNHADIRRTVPLCRYVMNTKESIAEAFRAYERRFQSIVHITTDSHRFGGPFEQQVREAFRAPNPPTAFWCRDDVSAMELIRVLRSFGLSVPRDISVIGFDDLEESASFDPPLTTLRNPVYELGYTAMSRLDELIRNVQPPQSRITRLPPVLCVRRSSTPRKETMIDN